MRGSNALGDDCAANLMSCCVACKVSEMGGLLALETVGNWEESRWVCGWIHVTILALGLPDEDVDAVSDMELDG